MKLWVGTAGYAYPAWVGDFYPPGTSSTDMLSYYARQFSAVEINSTFYRPPTIEQVEKMCRKVPAGFGFTLKVPRSASHENSPDELPAFHRAAEQFAARDCLLSLIVQIPEAFRNSAVNRAWLVHIREQLRPFPLAVEFRHRSWDVDALPKWAAKHGFDVVSVGVPDIPTLFPNGLRAEGPRVYARLHSENADAWYSGGTARYAYDYPDATLTEWASGLTAAAAAGRERALVFFNNCVGIQATTNAKRLIDLLRETAPAIEIVPPPQPVEPKGLFDDVE
ncbi:DUF72 domain-containing protein [Fimbriiglobus ruber]|uniref:DUF72 domain-containing protein n=1 Tax=Fimbriiglobus ruber TaxID=1908690 RepID=A0A225D7T0_9BACT|nr:DUF72 domain-containing protein [Fimbriiglobus ruber]OWK37660.1 hypothetical protein FRUB_06780 [Fimbriiglobus ruber]